jgi:uncharacterized repeat protein (TIGR03803 family)
MSRGRIPRILALGLLTLAAQTKFSAANATSEAVIYNFCDKNFCADGATPLGTVTLDAQGDVFGTTNLGGVPKDGCEFTDGCGAVYKLRLHNGFYLQKVLYSFCAQKGCADGAFPIGSLVEDTAGNLYGVTSNYGKHGYGTVFRISPKGKYKVLHAFCAKESCADGGNPSSTSAVLTYAGASSGAAYDGVSPLYGTTYVGGNANAGTIFKMVPNDKGKWTYSVFYKFCSQSGCSDGERPVGLVADDAGVLYGMTNVGGAAGAGTVFKLNGTTFTTLHSFCTQSGCADGTSPRGALAVDTDGNVFGIASEGGGANDGVLFKINAAGTYSILHSFCSEAACTDGRLPQGPPVLDKSGNLIGTTAGGGDKDVGAIYKLKGANYQVLYSFCPQYPTCSDGASPNFPVVLDSVGNIFGTTVSGGRATFGANGTVYELIH